MCVPSHMQLGARWELSVKENSMCGVLSMDRVTIEGWVDRNVHGKYHYSDSGYSTNVLLHIHLCWIFGHLLFPSMLGHLYLPLWTHTIHYVPSWYHHLLAWCIPSLMHPPIIFCWMGHPVHPKLDHLKEERARDRCPQPKVSTIEDEKTCLACDIQTPCIFQCGIQGSS